MRDHREGQDPTRRDITEQLHEAIRAKAGEGARHLRPRRVRLHPAAQPKRQTNVRKARRRQAQQSRKRNR